MPSFSWKAFQSSIKLSENEWECLRANIDTILGFHLVDLQGKRLSNIENKFKVQAAVDEIFGLLPGLQDLSESDKETARSFIHRRATEWRNKNSKQQEAFSQDQVSSLPTTPSEIERNKAARRRAPRRCQPSTLPAPSSLKRPRPSDEPELEQEAEEQSALGKELRQWPQPGKQMLILSFRLLCCCCARLHG